MMKKAIVGISAAALAAGLGIGIGTVATADTTTEPTPSASSSQNPSQDNTERSDSRSERGGLEGRGGKGSRGMDLSTLAEKLGVEEDALSEAVEAAREATRPTDEDRSSEEREEQTQAERETERSERQAAFIKALASELGIDEAKVTQAYEDIQAEREAERTAETKEVLDQAVTDGELTQSEADAVQKAIDAGIVGVRGGGGHR